jgi:hypothetical protein
VQKLKRTLLPIALVSSALLLSTGPAWAVLITGIGSDVIDYSFSSVQGGVTLSGSVNVEVADFNTVLNTITLSVTLENKTPTATAGNNRWTHWGFGSTPDVLSINFVDPIDGGMTGASISNFPALSLIEACSTSGNNCAGGGGGGIGENQSDTFDLVLHFADLTSSGVDLSPFGVKFQSVGVAGASAEFYTCVDDCAPTRTPQSRQGGSIPEPGTLTLFGLGLAGLAASRRRKR